MKYSDFEFNYASFILKPYANEIKSSSRLLKDIINKLNENDFPNDKKVIDRFKNRKDKNKRELVIISNRLSKLGVKCYGKIALIKNKAPFLWGGKDLIEEIVKESNKEFIEITNYVINFNDTADPVIMFEYNHEGPRISDIEYYFRQIGREFNIAKAVNTSLHLNVEYDKLDKDIKNIFGVTVKVNASFINNCNWVKSLKELNDDSGYKDVRLEFYYKREKDKDGSFIKNIKGLDFARNIISWLNKDKVNIEYLDDLKMTYQKDNEDTIVDMDFMKNKVISFVKIPLNYGDTYLSKDFKDILSNEFNYYISTGKTHDEIEIKSDSYV